MSNLTAVLAAFKEATRCDAAVWVEPGGGGPPVCEAGTYRGPPLTRWPVPSEAPVSVDTLGGPGLAAAVPGPAHAWLVVGPTPSSRSALKTHLRFLLPVVSHFLQASLEVEHAARELAERYEEINLLYTIGEILGRTVALEEATYAILTEISETVGASRATVLVHDRASRELRVVAALGARPAALPSIAVDDECSSSARVFRTMYPEIVEAGNSPCPQEREYRDGAMMSVPIVWSTREGPEALGVVNLSGRRGGQAFTAGDQKLVSAIASQLGTAIQNTRLVRASIAQEQLSHEMQMAHNLQMKLLPAGVELAPDADAAARVVPAESVGGDLYNFFRLGRGRVGVLLGDVSGHGYPAALIMTLVMSAASIQARTTSDPGATLGAMLSALRAELDATEMHLSVFYAVIDRSGGKLRFANAGHASAFLVHSDGSAERLRALDPPLGMGGEAPAVDSRKWDAAGDLLVLFTDGVSDARNHRGERFGEELVLDLVRRHRTEGAEAIVDRIFRELHGFLGDARVPDDLTVVVVRS
ncbi:MAG TPA: GAF domain-containing SpoIIE family protein phosphatase [Gemmatimonadaceae bacterium]|jgi:sigma-B regulation protein RsbU (phosphoserine phosphatase)|nr:GAF domain-containing SpoIIE family protein phosphatase [Gemmatimonadaceae bacterium]